MWCLWTSKDEAIEIAFTSFDEVNKECLEDVWFIVFGKDMFEISINVASDFLIKLKCEFVVYNEIGTTYCRY